MTVVAASIHQLPADVIERFGLRVDSVLSDDDSFITVLCHDVAGARIVVKAVHTRSADAYRRLDNETALVKQLCARPPLRLLRYRAGGRGYLLTEFDDGRLLWPDRCDAVVVHAVAVALAQFQSLQVSPRSGIRDREHVATYYLKVLSKHLLHLWPDYVSATEAARCHAILASTLPAIVRRRVPCHGDFLPTNLLFHDEDGTVTFTDLEGFMTGNHPLFDVLAFCSISALPLGGWTWQQAFLSSYLRAVDGAAGVDPLGGDYRDAYRGILIFFLAYRLNEARIGLTGGAYFDGIGKKRFLARKAARLAGGAADDDARLRAALETRIDNLRRALTPRGFRDHFETLHDPAMSVPATA